MTAIELSQEVWDHGLIPLPGARLSEGSLLALLRSPRFVCSTITIDEWADLSAESLGLSREQSTACMQLAGVLSDSTTHVSGDVGDEMRVPLGALLLLMWVQHANAKLTSVIATASRSQCATAVHPSMIAPASPRSGADSPLLSPSSPMSMHMPPTSPTLASPRSLAASSRLVSHQYVSRSHPDRGVGLERRKLVASSLRTLLLLAGTGSDRLSASQVDLLALLLRPQLEAAARLRARGKRAGSITECLGLWDSQPKAVLPLATVLAAVSAALPLVGTQTAQLPFSIDVLPAGRLFIDLDPPPTAPRALPPPVEPTPATDSGTHATAPAAGSGSLGCGEDRPLSIQVHMPSDEDDPAAPCSPTGGRPSGASGWVEWDDRCVVNEGEAVTARLLGARRRTLVFRGSRADATRTAVQIVDCHGCHIYVLAPVRSLEVVGCTNCTVMVGAVGRVASIRHCERLSLLTNAAALHAHSLNESSLQLSSATRPLLWGENHRLTLAPFGAVYASLPRHLSAAGLSPELRHNRWAEPICCLPSLTAGTAPDASGCFCLLAPRLYLPFHIPFDVPAGETAGGRIAPVVQLPDEYAEALACHAKQLHHFSEELGELMCSDGVKSEVGAALQARFREWLVRTGNMRQVVELLAAAPAASAG